MVKRGSSKFILAGVFVLLVVVGMLFAVTGKLGTVFKKSYQNEATETLDKANQVNYDIRRIKYEGLDGKSIEILQNGTIISINDEGDRKAVLGFSRLEGLFSRLTEEDLMRLQSQTGQGPTLTIETKSGAVYVIHINPNTDPIIDDLVDDIIDTEDTTFNPATPVPTPFIASTPSPSENPTPTPIGGSWPTPSPTPLPTDEPTPTPSPSPMLELVPFDCNDYALTRKATISNIICEPNQ